MYKLVMKNRPVGGCSSENLSLHWHKHEQ